MIVFSGRGAFGFPEVLRVSTKGYPSMETTRFQLIGWKAAAVAVVVLGFVGYRYVSLRADLPDELARELKFRLEGEYSASALRELDGVDLQSLSASSVDPRVRRVLDASQVEVVSMSARGSNPVVVRVEIRVAGRDPPDGEPVRYYRAEHRGISGWKVKRRVSALSYYLKLF